MSFRWSTASSFSSSLFSIMRAISLLFIAGTVFAGSPFTIDRNLDGGRYVTCPWKLNFFDADFYCSAKIVGSSYNSGGTVSVQGNAITIPDNMLVQFPGTIVSWVDFVASTLLDEGV